MNELLVAKFQIMVAFYSASAFVHECNARHWYSHFLRPSVCDSHTGIVANI